MKFTQHSSLMIYNWLAVSQKKKKALLTWGVLVNKDLYLVIIFYLNNQFLSVKGLGIKERLHQLQRVNRCWFDENHQVTCAFQRFRQLFSDLFIQMEHKVVLVPALPINYRCESFEYLGVRFFGPVQLLTSDCMFDLLDGWIHCTGHC